MAVLLTIKAPFPWFGGKSRAAHLVWDRFGDVPNYVEPFAGSLATLLARPTPARIETVNDLDCYLANFWRAVAVDPEAVARYADWPINEIDLHARHRWLVSQADFRVRMRDDPEFHDAKVAGWWVWGICQWIGSGWCSRADWEGCGVAGGKSRGIQTAMPSEQLPYLKSAQGVTSEQIPFLNRPGQGIHAKRSNLARGGRGVHGHGQLPALRGDSGAAGVGIHASGLSEKLPLIGGGSAKGVLAPGLADKMPKIGNGHNSPLATRTGEAIADWMLALQSRLRRVRVACGDWSRILGPSVTEYIGVTGIMLDPPYGDCGRDPSIYTHDDLGTAGEVRAWALANGDNPKLRIALCGYEGEHDMPGTWEMVAWKAMGGYASAAGNHENAARERIWFSPACLRPQGNLFR